MSQRLLGIVVAGVVALASPFAIAGTQCGCGQVTAPCADCYGGSVVSGLGTSTAYQGGVVEGSAIGGVAISGVVDGGIVSSGISTGFVSTNGTASGHKAGANRQQRD